MRRLIINILNIQQAYCLSFFLFLFFFVGGGGGGCYKDLEHPAGLLFFFLFFFGGVGEGIIQLLNILNTQQAYCVFFLSFFFIVFFFEGGGGWRGGYKDIEHLEHSAGLLSF